MSGFKRETNPLAARLYMAVLKTEQNRVAGKDP
jgi:hypothetical protein